MSVPKSKSSKSKYPNDPQQTRWIIRTRQGDKTAFGNLVAKYRQPVYNLCYRKLGNVTEVEDADPNCQPTAESGHHAGPNGSSNGALSWRQATLNLHQAR